MPPPSFTFDSLFDLTQTTILSHAFQSNRPPSLDSQTQVPNTVYAWASCSRPGFRAGILCLLRHRLAA